MFIALTRSRTLRTQWAPCDVPAWLLDCVGRSMRLVATGLGCHRGLGFIQMVVHWLLGVTDGYTLRSVAQTRSLTTHTWLPDSVSYGRSRRDPLWVKPSLAVAAALLQKIAFTDLEVAPGSVRQ